MSETLHKIQGAYADAGRNQPLNYPPLPAWEALPLEIREAFVHVFVAGGRNALDEACRNYAKEPSTRDRRNDVTSYD